MRSLRETLPPGVGDVPALNGALSTFVDSELEASFQRENYEIGVRKFVRFSVTLSIAVFLAYGVHDALVVPEVLPRVLAIRFGFFAPIAVLVLLFVFTNRKAERHAFAMLVFGLAVNASVFWIGAISNPAGFFIYTSYAIVFVTLGPFLARMSVLTQCVYTLLTILLYNGFDQLAHAAPMVRLSMNLALVSLGSIGALAARELELQARLAFVQRRVIREQMALVDQERRKSEALLLNILPRRIADRLKAGAGTIADEFPSVTVLFSDIVGFTQLSARLGPEELVRSLDEIFSRFDEIAEELSLEKIKTIGDAYMVAGGIPLKSSDHATRICEMALRMQAATAELSLAPGATLSVRIGVHTGPAVAGVIGKKKFSYDVWGDTVNTASRMESHGIPGAIQVSEATYLATKDAFDFELRGESEIKGKGTMRTYLLRGRRAEALDRAATMPPPPSMA